MYRTLLVSSPAFSFLFALYYYFGATQVSCPIGARNKCVFYARPPVTFSAGKHKINRISLNSLNRQALTGIDRCSDGGMWMSHVFSIIYTALLFLSPPLRQVSILLHRNQSVICQTLSIQRLIYVSYCGWLHASATAGKEQMGRETFCKKTPSFRARQPGSRG